MTVMHLSNQAFTAMFKNYSNFKCGIVHQYTHIR